MGFVDRLQIAQGEYNLETNDIDLEFDHLEQTYLNEENQKQLREELSQLLEEGKNDER